MVNQERKPMVFSVNRNQLFGKRKNGVKAE
jgi:hypothetical protein